MRGVRAALRALALIPAPLTAQPVAELTQVPQAAVVLDIRAEDACREASLPGARCLPADVLFARGDGPAISFPALRWYLGTLGLSGAETAVIFPGDAAEAPAAAALLYLAGQREVALFRGQAALSAPGESRSFSREAVFAAPMRMQALRIDPAAQGPLTGRLAAFARGQGDTVAFPPGT